MSETESFMATFKEGTTRHEFVWGGNIGLMYFARNIKFHLLC
jgi:hypothetical protein